MRTAVVILNYNGLKFLKQFLSTLIVECPNDSEIIVADNNSSDGTVPWLRENYPDLKIIQNRQNFGFAGGYNAALNQVDAKYFVILNSDIEVAPGWLTPLIDYMEQHPNVAACQPKILSFSDRQYFEYAGAGGGFIDIFGFPFCRGRVFTTLETDSGQYNDIKPVFWATGACMVVRADYFRQAGGFDDFFFAHMEEIDLCWRIQLAGYKIYSCPASVVYHVGGGTLPKGNSLKTYLNFRNNRIMMSKNIPLAQKLWIMPLRTMLDFVSALKGLVKGDVGYFIAICRAHLAFIKWWLFYKRKSVFPKSKTGKLSGLSLKNLAWQHFVKKKKYFTEIVDQTH